MDSDSDFYGRDDNEIANLESRVEDFNVESYWRLRGQSGIAHPGIKQEASSSSSTTNMTPTTATKLHNPYEGQASAKQLGETIDEFLKRLPPGTTDVTPEIPWIYVANPFIPRENQGGEEAPAESGAQLQTLIEGGGERLELFGDFLRTKQEKGRGGRAGTAMASEVSREREECVGDILMLARAMKVKTGKWMLFVEPAFVNDIWATVARATVKNELGIAAKVAPREERGSAKERLICIYTYDFSDKADIARILHRMRQLELVRDRVGSKPIYYKADAFTYLGIGYGNPWGMRASLYSSRDVFAYLREKDGKAPKKDVKEEDGQGWMF
ncbi:UPF0696 protein C11orf68 [Cytospora mali]|uniref:UPF0696 protein C11orf68 n=1 Tax=Cytospora mali TaxID=578113 RepID=A0A194V634_CYTMA|nr:UPF0696 protein C11orf68 [Valsa mali var. pyri (nom. inval.)]